MAKRQKGEVVNPYAKIIGSENRFVIPYAEARIDQDGTVEFYDAEKHKGKLTCPECELPRLMFKKAAEHSGRGKVRRDHFARYAGEDHDLHCEVGLRALEYPGQERVIDKSKAPYVYINTGRLPQRPPYKSIFTRAAAYLPQNQTMRYDWLKAIDYEKNSRDFDRIKNPDFKDRALLNPITKVTDYLRLIKTMPRQKLEDTWIISNGVAIRFDQTIIRETQAVSADRTRDDLTTIRTNFGLPAKYPLATNGKYDRFTKLIDTLNNGVRYPVLLHFKVEERPTKKDGDSGLRLRISLPTFMVENPVYQGDRRPPLTLPEIKVYRYIHIKDSSAFSQIKAGQEYFAIAHPYLFKDDGVNGAYNLHFDVFRASDITPMTQDDLTAAIRKTAAARERQALKKMAEQELPFHQPANTPA